VIRQSELRIRKEVITTMIPFAEHRQQFASGARKEFESLIDRGFLTLNQHTAALENEYRGVQDFEMLKSEEHAIDIELATLGAALAEAQSAIDELRGTYDAGRLTFPIDGVVTRIASNKGSVVRAGEPLIELSSNQRFILAYLPTGGLYSVHEGDEVTINTGLRSTYGIISKVEPIAAALPREFQRAFTPVERQQVIRIEFSAGEVPPPLFTKVWVGRSSAARQWLEQIARRWHSAT
jgi:multidrug resistance efflux pump